VLGIELHDLARAESQAESDRDDPTSGGAGDEVEVVEVIRSVLQLGEDGGAEYPA
jgi:hypothetical protein